jgi:rare lipoprotein A
MALVSQSCAKRTPARKARIPRIGETESGVASWYGHPYHGRRAANGEIYDMHKLTAAHRTWAFDTIVRVRNLSNDKEVDVRITDRGPFVRGRIIDLSRAAAEQIDLVRPGVAKVKLKVIAASPAPQRGRRAAYGVQVGAFADYQTAERLRGELQSYGHVDVIRKEGTPVLWRVVAGREQDAAHAAALAERLRERNPDAMVVRLDD